MYCVLMFFLGFLNIIISQEININNRLVKFCGNVFVYDNLFCILSVYWIKDGKKIDIKENDGRFL